MLTLNPLKQSMTNAFKGHFHQANYTTEHHDLVFDCDHATAPMVTESNTFRRHGIRSTSHGTHQHTPSAPTIAYQTMLPPEIWLMIFSRLSTVSLFSIHNCSVLFRALVQPNLLQALAGKSLHLFLYQEYVRRISVRFVFDHFDPRRQRLVFRPADEHSQHRFKSGRTLQSPQLEDIQMSNMCPGRSRRPRLETTETGLVVYPGTAQVNPRLGARAALARIPILEPAVAIAAHGVESADEDQQHQQQAGQLQAAAIIAPPMQASITPSATTASTTTANAASRTNRRTTELAGMGQNLIDRACPMRIKKTGYKILDGQRHSFGNDYPWKLHSEVSAQTMGLCQWTSPGRRLPPSAMREDQPKMKCIREATRDVIDPVDVPKGYRYLRTIQFECHINFLDPRRTTRNVIGRWIECKFLKWTRALERLRMRRLSNGSNSVQGSLSLLDEGQACKGKQRAEEKSEQMNHLNAKEREHDPSGVSGAKGSNDKSLLQLHIGGLNHDADDEHEEDDEDLEDMGSGVMNMSLSRGNRSKSNSRSMHSSLRRGASHYNPQLSAVARLEQLSLEDSDLEGVMPQTENRRRLAI